LLTAHFSGAARLSPGTLLLPALKNAVPVAVIWLRFVKNGQYSLADTKDDGCKTERKQWCSCGRGSIIRAAVCTGCKRSGICFLIAAHCANAK